jgi:hypothetical protein
MVTWCEKLQIQKNSTFVSLTVNRYTLTGLGSLVTIASSVAGFLLGRADSEDISSSGLCFLFGDGGRFKGLAERRGLDRRGGRAGGTGFKMAVSGILFASELSDCEFRFERLYLKTWNMSLLSFFLCCESDKSRPPSGYRKILDLSVTVSPD